MPTDKSVIKDTYTLWSVKALRYMCKVSIYISITSEIILVHFFGLYKIKRTHNCLYLQSYANQ